jgi:hypothetical protein
MNTNRITMQTRLAIAAAMLITSAGWVAAGESPTAKGGAAQVIQLHAPNNATPSVTVWTAKPASPARRETQTAKGGAARLIYLHAPNNATPAVTVWTGK